MDVDRTTALTHYLRFLAGNPGGNATTRSLVLGALAPLSVWSASVFALGKTSKLEIVGTYGLVDELTGGLRAVASDMPMPLAEAFSSKRPIALTTDELHERYPTLRRVPSEIPGDMAGLDEVSASLPAEPGDAVFAPLVYSGAAIGAVALIQERPRPWAPADWEYLDGALAATAIWLTNKRDVLADRWRRAAPPRQRDVWVSERQRSILEMIAQNRTNRDIARRLGYSVPTVKKDIGVLMRLLGTHDRRSTAGRAREIGLLPERRGGSLAEPREPLA